jgi:hypothetical protein
MGENLIVMPPIYTHPQAAGSVSRLQHDSRPRWPVQETAALIALWVKHIEGSTTTMNDFLANIQAELEARHLGPLRSV